MKFGPERRIRKRSEFQELQSRGRRIATENFVFIVAPALSSHALPRLGITVTRRVGNSVRRSRIKRIVRAAFQAENGLIPPGYDLVVICRRDRLDLESTDVVAQFSKVAKKVRRALESFEMTPARATASEVGSESTQRPKFPAS